MKTKPIRASRPPLRFLSELRAAALRLIVGEAASMGWDFRIEDRMAVGPSTLRRAA